MLYKYPHYSTSLHLFLAPMSSAIVHLNDIKQNTFPFTNIKGRNYVKNGKQSLQQVHEIIAIKFMK